MSFALKAISNASIIVKNDQHYDLSVQNIEEKMDLINRQ
jgi:hypothetical protein